MRNVAIIALNDVRIFLKDKIGYVWLFCMPLIFTYFFGMAMRPGNDKPTNPRPSVLIENNDTGYVGKLLMKEMQAQGMTLVDSEEKDNASRGISIPADFTQRVESKESVKITFFKLEESATEAAAMVELRLVRAIIGVTSGLFALATEEQGVLTEEALSGMLQREDCVQLDVRFAGKRPVPLGFEQSVPGYMVMFTLMNLLMFGGISIASERTNGVLKRISVHPIDKWQLVLGKISGRFGLGLVQIAFFLAAGRFLFGIDYAGNLVPITITLLVLAWLSAALGVLVGALIASPERVSGVCLLLSLAMAALGGCWWPMEVVPDTMKTVGHIFPTAWAMDALHQLISFGGNLARIQLELVVLTVYALAATALAARFLRYA